MTEIAPGLTLLSHWFAMRSLCRLAAAFLAAWLASLPSSSQAAIGLLSGENLVRAIVNDGAQTDIRTVPADESSTVTASVGNSLATTAYSVAVAGDSASFEWQFTHTRDGSWNSLAQSISTVTFNVATDTTYEITGSYQLAGGKTIVQFVLLYEDAPFGQTLLNSNNVSLNTRNEGFEVGEFTGEDHAGSFGLTSGTLSAGKSYGLLAIHYIKTDFNNEGFEDLGATASGDLRLTLGGGVVSGGGAGSSQSSPILPDGQLPNGGFVFNNVPSDRWFDPPSTFGYTYEMTTPGSLFTSISGFPTGFVDDFTVMVGSANLGQYGPGDTLLFPGGGVSSFSILGINPLVDGTDPAAFPLKLTFNTPTASFTMLPLQASAVPEPGSLAAWSFGALFSAIAASCRREKKRLRGWLLPPRQNTAR